jgi:dephospho-CoA kinase
MKLLGLTGGIGMGKSTAAGLLLKLGARVVDTDEIARDVVRPGQPALLEIQSQFGQEVLAADGSLDRQRLAGLVFNDSEARKRLEAILHPRIRQCWQAQVAQWRGEGCPVAAVVIPLLFETQAEGQFDKIICVVCSPASQKERLRQRGWTDGQTGQRMAAQLPVEQKIARSHFVVWTEGSLEVHQRQLETILGRI